MLCETVYNVDKFLRLPYLSHTAPPLQCIRRGNVSRFAPTVVFLKHLALCVRLGIGEAGTLHTAAFLGHTGNMCPTVVPAAHSSTRDSTPTPLHRELYVGRLGGDCFYYYITWPLSPICGSQRPNPALRFGSPPCFCAYYPVPLFSRKS